MTTPTPHIRAEQIKQWVEDTSQEIWAWNHSSQAWSGAGPANLMWDGPECPYSIGPKPTTTPVRMCTLGGLQFPEPLREAPEEHTKYCVVQGYTWRCSRWDGDDTDMERLSDGVVHLTREAAEQHCAALRAANLQAISPREGA